MPKLGYVDLPFGQPPEPDPGTTRVGVDNAGSLIVSIGGSAFSPIGGGGFGSDVTVPLANSSGTDVTGLELQAALTNLTPGSEVSQWTIKLINAGVQTTAMIITPAQTQFPIGTAAAPGIAFQGATGYGFNAHTSLTRTDIIANGAIAASGQSGIGMVVPFDGGGYYMGSLSQTSVQQVAATGDMILATGGNFVIGLSAALSTSATVGHLEIPTCAGTPTGTVVVRSGKAAIIYDTTNNKLAVSPGGGVWKQVALA